jgi:hypothetical protein
MCVRAAAEMKECVKRVANLNTVVCEIDKFAIGQLVTCRQQEGSCSYSCDNNNNNAILPNFLVLA